MLQVNIHEAKTHLSALVEKAADGAPFIIAKSGKPMVKVIPYRPHGATNQRVGFLKGKIKIPEDFDTIGESEISDLFEVTE